MNIIIINSTQKGSNGCQSRIVDENNLRKLFSSTILEKEATDDDRIWLDENNNRKLYYNTLLGKEATDGDRI